MIRFVRDVALRVPLMLQPQTEIRGAEEQLLKHHTSEIYVVDECEMLLGIVPDYEIINYRLLGGDGGAPLSALMSPVQMTLDSNDSLAVGARLLTELKTQSLPVLQQGRVIGQFDRSTLIRILSTADSASAFETWQSFAPTTVPTRFAKRESLVWTLPEGLRGAG